MKKVGDFLNQYAKKNTSDEIVDRLLDDPIIRRFVLDHDLKHETIVQGINDFLTFRQSKEICNQCLGLYECKMSSLGMTPHLIHMNGDVQLEYRKCRYNMTKDSLKKIKTMYIPRKVLNADLADIDLVGKERKEIHQYIMDFLKEYTKENPKKGLYLTGIFGAGKTYILAAIANELAKQGHKIIFAYYPDLVRELKSSIGTGDLEEKIEELKKIDFLFFDDFGGEAPSAFVRDEILGPILQHRLLDHMPTFFSSNIRMKSLISSLQTDSTQTEQVKASRIYERIKELAIEFELSEKPLHIS